MKTYFEITQWMFAQLPMYQQQGAIAYKADLGNALKLMVHLGHPEKALKLVHVAGTNGKGSTSSMIASVLQEAGYKVGLYTSPHLKDFRERIKINGLEISEEFVIAFITKHKTFFEENDLSFFEMTVGMAFEYFKKESVDVAVIEVGMGGRLDATNVITPLVTAITNIGIDHTAFLGNTLEAIAGEKAGIAKVGVPLVVGEYTMETHHVFLSKAQEKQTQVFFTQDLMFSKEFVSDLKGDYQKKNIKVARQVIAILRKKFNITEEQEQSGLLNVVRNTKLQGRWQLLGENPKIIADTGHNEHGLKIVIEQLKKEKYNQLYIVFGVVSDKDLSGVLPLLPQNAYYFFATPNINRGLSAEELSKCAKEFKLRGEVCVSVSEAYLKAKQQASREDVIYIGGSTFVVAEIL